ncbi:MAG: GntR family transcriptional regulator [Chloroflexi bacterium]|nr:GntR family transcriptional regulator [Chloroflexota bacterium]
MAVDAPGLPLYQQIVLGLRDQIARNELGPGDRVETELDLMARYGVSRATVRQALGRLIADGSLEVRRGLGTFVRARPVEHALGGFYTFSREIERHGMRPGTRVMDLRVESATQEVAEHLDLSTGTPVVALSRIRLADDDPLVTETSYLPAARFPGLEHVDFTHARLYDTLADVFGVRPVRARETFEPVLLSAAEAAILGGARRDPALRVERIAFDAQGTIIEYCHSTLRGDRYRYSVELRES